MADILGMMDYIRQQSDAGRQQGQQTRMADLYAQAMQAPADQRGNLLAQIARISPDSANSAQKSLSGMDAEAATGLAQEAGTFLAVAQMGDPATTQQAYMRLAQRARMAGHPVPDQFDERFLPGIEKLAGATSPGGAVQSTYVDNNGQRVAIMRDGSVRVLGQNAPSMQIMDTGDGIYGINKGNLQAAPVMLGGPQASAPTTQYAGPATQGALNPTQDFPQLAQAYGATPTSLYRTPQHNAEVGGVPNSQHMQGTAGDFVVPAAQKAQFIADARARGYEPIDEGDHVHLELPRGAHAAGQFGPGQQLRSAPKPPPEITPYQQAELGMRAQQMQIAQQAREDAAAAKKAAQDAAAQQKAQAAQARQGAAVEAAQQLIDSIDALQQNPGYQALGTMMGDAQTRIPLIRTDAKDAQAQLDNIAGQVALATMSRLKALSSQGATGFGALSAPELHLLQNSIATLKPGISHQQLERSLQVIRHSMQKVADWRDGGGAAPPQSAAGWSIQKVSP